MANPKLNERLPALPVAAPADARRWQQQVRLACVQAICARAVASASVYDADKIIESAKALANYVVGSD